MGWNRQDASYYKQNMVSYPCESKLINVEFLFDLRVEILANCVVLLDVVDIKECKDLENCTGKDRLSISYF
jgi:hypothetical protein